MLSEYTLKLYAGQALLRHEINRSVALMLDEATSDEDIKKLLLAYNEKGIEVRELAAFVVAFQAMMPAVVLSRPAYDICGTGGIKKARFNVSTAAAFVAAAAGVPVAKHAGRGARRPNGSLDFLDALGCRTDLPLARICEAFDHADMCFLPAVQLQPLFARVAQARRAITKPTIFNLFGPLVNPAWPVGQLIGAYDASSAKLIARACLDVYLADRIVCVSAEGCDDISTRVSTAVLRVNTDRRRVEEDILLPRDFTLTPDAREIPVGDARANAAAFLRMLDGKELALADLLAANAGAVLHLAHKASTIPDGFRAARAAITSGAAKAKFLQYKTFTQQAR